MSCGAQSLRFIESATALPAAFLAAQMISLALYVSINPDFCPTPAAAVAPTLSAPCASDLSLAPIPSLPIRCAGKAFEELLGADAVRSSASAPVAAPRTGHPEAGLVHGGLWSPQSSMAPQSSLGGRSSGSSLPGLDSGVLRSHGSQQWPPRRPAVEQVGGSRCACLVRSRSALG